MRRAAEVLTVLCAVALVIMLGGCGGGGAPGLGPMPEGYGRVTVSVGWPDAEVQSRAISTGRQSIKVVVSAPDIPTPVTATINRPANSGTLSVPAGNDRVVDAQGSDAPDAGGNQIQKAYATVMVPQVANGGTYNVKLYLGDMLDPGDDTAAGATLVPADGMPSAWHVLHRNTDVEGGWLDKDDWFKFAALAAQPYTIKTQDVPGPGSVAYSYYKIQLYDTDGATLLAETAWDPPLANNQHPR